jgi:hypothetical protein
MMHLLLDTAQDKFAAAARHRAAGQGIWAWPRAMTLSILASSGWNYPSATPPAPWRQTQARAIIAALIGP